MVPLMFSVQDFEIYSLVINQKTYMSVYPDNTREAVVMKILLLGESNVGKTSLVTRYAHDKFDAQSNLLTVGIDIRKLNKQVNGKHILLELWDTAGQEKYKTIPTQYFKGVQGILLVYDITDAETFEKIQDWLDKQSYQYVSCWQQTRYGKQPSSEVSRCQNLCDQKGNGVYLNECERGHQCVTNVSRSNSKHNKKRNKMPNKEHSIGKRQPQQRNNIREFLLRMIIILQSSLIQIMNTEKKSYKTSICRHFTQKGYCSLYQKCHFAHGEHELRNKTDPVPNIVPPQVEPISIYKTTLCKYFMNGYCRNAYMCPFAHGITDLHKISVKSNETSQQEYGNAGQFLFSILKSLENVFAEDEQKKQLVKKGMDLVSEKNLHHADQIIANIVKCRNLSEKQRIQCQTILQNAYALHKLRYSPF